MLRNTFLALTIIPTLIFSLGLGHAAFAQELEYIDTLGDGSGGTYSPTPMTAPNSRNGAGKSPASAACTDPQGCNDAGEVPTQSCEAVAKTAATACLTPGTAGMNPDEAVMYTSLMNQLVQTGAQIASMGKNMAGQCEMQAKVSGLLTGINTAKGSACWVYVNKCKSTCDWERNDNLRKANAASNADTQTHFQGLAKVNKKTETTCHNYSGQVAAMAAGAIQGLGNFAINNQCAKDLAAYDAQLAAQKPITLPTIGDCSDPNNQSLTCFCQKDANAKSPMCAGLGSGSLNGGSTVATVPNGMKPASGSSPYASTVGEGLGEGDTIDPFAGGKKDSGGGGANAPGDGGSGAPGGSGISSLSSEGGGSGAGGDPRSAITGTSGGNSSGLGGTGGGGGAGGLSRNNGDGGGAQGFMDKFNLSKFLPTSKYKTRGIAGMSVKSVDGITGPTGPSIWEKATRQYQEQIQKQNVLLDR